MGTPSTKLLFATIFWQSRARGYWGLFWTNIFLKMIVSTSWKIYAVKEKILSLQFHGQNPKIVTKIEFTPFPCPQNFSLFQMMEMLCFYFFQIPVTKGFKFHAPKLAHILIYCLEMWWNKLQVTFESFFSKIYFSSEDFSQISGT